MRVVCEGVELCVHLNRGIYSGILQVHWKMTEQTRELKLSHQDITGVFASLLALPRAPKALHPSQDRARYSELLEWLQKAMAGVVRGGQGARGKAACEEELRVMTALLEELAQLGKRECAEKGALMERVKEYLVGTLNAYWAALESSNKEVWYEFQNNSVRVERQYMEELKRLQAETDQLRKDKQHRWRNMFMLIKDNRVHRRQNHKLMRSITYQMEKNVALAEQMILLREENQKLKVKLACFQDDPVRIESFAETHLKLLQLQESIRTYPKRSKKILKNDLVKIQIQQITNINDKITFIIKAIEETGQIIDEFYDEENIWSNFQYNISTQTENSTDEKSTNTPITRTLTTEASVTPHQLAAFELTETYSLLIRGFKKEKKQTKDGRDSRVPLLSATYAAPSRFSARRQEAERMREISHRSSENTFSICQSVKMTISHGRCIYISTYNTEIFNGPELLRKIEERVENQTKIACEEIKEQQEKEEPQLVETYVQTDPQEYRNGRSQGKKRTKYAASLPLFTAFMQEEERNKRMAAARMKINGEVNFEFRPYKEYHQPKLKFTINIPPIIQNENKQKQTPLSKSGITESMLDSTRFGHRSNKRLNSLEKFHWQGDDGVIGKRIDRDRDADRNDFCTQTDEKSFLFKQTQSTSNIESKDQHPPTTKDNSNNNSSFLQDIKQVRKDAKQKVFNQSAEGFSLTKPKSKLARRSEMSPLKQAQPKKIQKLSKNQLMKHKRTSTESNDLENISESSFKPNKQFKIKPLHRISEVLTEADPIHQDSNFNNTNSLNPMPPTRDRGLPLTVTREGEVRGGDFAKGVEKILKSMDIRRNEIISNGYSLKTYLSSYFKCLYGREIYHSFLTFLSTSEPQEAVVCFSRLGNTKAPEPYLVDIFRGFVKAIGKCYVLGESPCSPRLRSEILRFLAGLFLEQQQINTFALRMRNRGCYTLMGWFNSLQHQLRTESLHSQLYLTLSLWMNQASDMISYNFIEELSFFMQTDPQTSKFLIRCKFFLGEKVPLHRFCLFAHRCQWRRMLTFRTSIQEEYERRLGSFSTQEALHRIELNRAILGEFKELQRCFNYWVSMEAKYGSKIDQELLMLVELNIQEYRLKNEMPISRELKYLSLVFEGLQKKKEFESLRAKVENGAGRDSLITSKTVI